MKKLLSTLLSVTLLFASSTTTAFASEITAPGDATTSAVLTSDAALLSVTVPMSVLIYKDASGAVITPDTIPITNNSAGPVVVSNIAVIAKNGWTLDLASTDYTHFKVGKKNFRMTLNGLDPSTGALSFPTPINGSESLLLDMWADVSPQKEAINTAQIGEMVVTVGWYEDETSYPAGYVLATDADFSGDTNGSFTYIGTAEYVIIPETIKGVPVTSYTNMFMFSSVKGVISANPNITNMDGMFKYTSSTILELDIDTSSVTRMVSTFESSAATTLDLSSFDTSSVTTMFDAFANATATTGYANTQADADKFNASFGKPSALTFVVKDTEGSYPAGYVLLTDSDFSGTVDGDFQYTGYAEYVVIPDTIKGVSITSYYTMFFNSHQIKGVISTNPNITNTSLMFANSTASTLDLSGTDFSNVTNTDYMFQGASTTIGYAKTQADADKLNASLNKPATLIFTVK
jgi:surface protein